MSGRRESDLLDHMIAAARQIGTYVAGMDRKSLQTDVKRAADDAGPDEA